MEHILLRTIINGIAFRKLWTGFCVVILCYLSNKQAIAQDAAHSSDLVGNIGFDIISLKTDSAKLIPIYKKLHDKGTALMQTGANEEAIRCFNLALIYTRVFLAKEWESTFYISIGNTYLTLGKNDEAIDSYIKALKNNYCICKDRKHIYENENRVYNNMVGVYISIKDFEKAIFYCKKSLQSFYITRDTANYAASLCEMARIFDHTGNYDSAIYYNKKALKAISGVVSAANREPDKKYLENLNLKNLLLNNIASNYLTIGATDSAERYLDMSAPEFHLLSSNVRSLLLFNYGALYLELGHAPKALIFYKKVLDIAEADKRIEMKAWVWEGLSKTYEQLGNYKLALRYKQMFQDARDSINMLGDIHKINHLEIQYLTERKDRKIAETQLLIVKKDAQIRERNSWLYIISIGAIVLSGLLLISYRNYRHKQLLSDASLLNVQQQQEISNLQAKVAGEEQERSRIANELHDGIVSQLLSIKLHLNTISATHSTLVPVSELGEVTRQVAYAAQDLRQTAHNLMPELLIDLGIAHALSGLCKRTEKHTGMAVHFQTTGICSRLQEQQELALLRIVQELIQNVLKHADATRLIVQLSCREHMLSITVEDNGIGLPVTTREETVAYGLGLKSVRERVKLLKGYFDIKSHPGKGTTAYVEMEINERTDASAHASTSLPDPAGFY